MTTKNATLFKVFLNHFHPGAQEKILASLPQREREEIIETKITSQNPVAFLSWPQELIARTHYSWLAPIIRQTPAFLRKATVAALPEPQSSKLLSFLHISSPCPKLAPPVKTFLINAFFQQWSPPAIIPLTDLQQSQLTPLLYLSKNELVELIDLLSIHDLADSMRRIVDKKLLEKIYHCLSLTRQKYLRFCLRNKEKATAPELEVSKWNGESDSLHVLLHQRGLLRLGKALSGQSQEFIWHLTHVLDTGRGQTLIGYSKKKEIAGITPLLIQQVLSILNFLKQKDKT